MTKFVLGFFFACLIFVPEKAINFIGAAAVVAKSVFDRGQEFSKQTADEITDELKRRELVK